MIGRSIHKTKYLVLGFKGKYEIDWSIVYMTLDEFTHRKGVAPSGCHFGVTLHHGVVDAIFKEWNNHPPEVGSA